MQNEAGTADGMGFELGQDSPDSLSHMIALEYLIPTERGDAADFFKIAMTSKVTPQGKNFQQIVFGLDMGSLVIRTDGQPNQEDLAGLHALMVREALA